MRNPLSSIEKSFQGHLEKAKDLAAVSEIRVTYLGKKGKLTEALRSIGALPEKERPEFGSKVNELRGKIETELSLLESNLEGEVMARTLKEGKIDIGLPGRAPQYGSVHPIRQAEARIVDIFSSLGFSVADGPEIETDYYNFEALNFPEDHPARDMQDTLFLEDGLLLRTHTSPVQIRYMEKHPPPFQLIVPGRVYRHDSDVTHSPVFHQVEGLCVGPGITFAHLKGTLEAFVSMMFGKEFSTRFRPSFFPFTEPSAEVDMAYKGKGQGEPNWMEILGCGMVDPNVFEAVGKNWKNKGKENPYDPEKISGFAFGIGIERIAMVAHGIDDIRHFYENDVRFLQQFRGA